MSELKYLNLTIVRERSQPPVAELRRHRWKCYSGIVMTLDPAAVKEAIEFLSHVIDEDDKVDVPAHLSKVLEAAELYADSQPIEWCDEHSQRWCSGNHCPDEHEVDGGCPYPKWSVECQKAERRLI